MGFNIAVELRYEVLQRKHRNIIFHCKKLSFLIYMALSRLNFVCMLNSRSQRTRKKKLAALAGN
jgi:hypothetical protein